MVRRGKVDFPKRCRTQQVLRLSISLRRTPVGAMRPRLQRRIGTLRMTQVPHRQCERSCVIDLMRHRARRLKVHVVAFIGVSDDGTSVLACRKQIEVGQIANEVVNRKYDQQSEYRQYASQDFHGAKIKKCLSSSPSFVF